MKIALLLILVAAAVLGWRSPLAAQAVGQVFRDCDACPEMVVVPPGSFMMGSADSEAYRDANEGPQHRVTIDYAFAVGVYEVSFDEWDACVRGGGCGGWEPPGLWGRGRLPVNRVSWEDARAYADWLSRQTGEGYRLLSEAEWEYAARAGTEGPRYWTTQGVGPIAEHGYYANYNGRFLGDEWDLAAPVGGRRPNAFGLYDVLGNMWEWVEDCWYGNYESAPTDGSARRHTNDCLERVIRGGSYASGGDYLRSADRARWEARFRDSDIGFRVARTTREGG